MTQLRMWIALAAVALTAAHQEPKKSTAVGAPRDGAIMDVVMVDLITAKDSPWEDYHGADRPEAGKRRIRLSRNPLTYAVTEDRVLERYDKGQWNKLTRTELDLVREAAKNLVQRRTERNWLDSYQPGDKRIIVVEEKEQQEGDKPMRTLDQPQVFRAFAPGYSRDGKIACVHLSYPWSGGFHGGVATYVLAKRKGKWLVLVRQFIRYV